MGNLYHGALQDYAKTADKWATSGNLKVSLVQSPATIDRDDLTLADFIADPNTLIGTQQSLPGTKSVVWGDNANKPGGPAGFNAQEFLWTGQVTFTGVTQGTTIAGVVGYDGTSADPANAKVYFFDTNALNAGGGNIRWGTTGTNCAFRLFSRNVGANKPVVFQGFMKDIYETAEYWGQDTMNTGYALVRDLGLQTPNPDWITVQNAIDAGVIFVGGASPGGAGQPVKTGGGAPDRFDSQWEGHGVNDVWSFIYNSSGNILWDDSVNPLTDGHIISAILTFAYVGVYSATTAKVWFWDGLTTPVSIGAGQDVIYGNLGTTTKLGLAIQA